MMPATALPAGPYTPPRQQPLYRHASRNEYKALCPPPVLSRAPAVFTVNCSFCNSPITLPDDATGKTINCPNCKKKNLISEQPTKSIEDSSTCSSGPKTEPSDDGK